MAALPEQKGEPAGVAATPASDRDGLPPLQRRRAMLVIILGITLAVLDGSIVNLALPGIARELRSSAAHSIWVVNAYQMASLIVLLPLASLGERIGYRRVYLLGMAVFALSSVGAMLASKTRSSDLALVALEDFGLSYARTLHAWRERFLAQLAAVRAQGFDERFIRMWEFYLAYCEGGFRERAIGVSHLLMARPGWRPLEHGA